MKLRMMAVTAIALGMLGTGSALSACGSGPSSPTVPVLPGASGGASGGPGGSAQANPNVANGDGSVARRDALHKAADCIRQHGAPRYQDPVLTADGRVYTDQRTYEDAIGEDGLAALETACGELIRAARFSPYDQAPPPPKVVQAGVKVAQCLRANGLPNVKDPTANSQFTPGHGFGHSAEEMPNGKDDTFLRATTACKSDIEELNRLSSLGGLGDA